MNTLKIAAVISLAALALGTPVPPAESQSQPQTAGTAAAVPVYNPPSVGRRVVGSEAARAGRHGRCSSSPPWHRTIRG